MNELTHRFEVTDLADEFQELGLDAVWSVTTAKSGFGVDHLCDDDITTFWQYALIFLSFLGSFGEYAGLTVLIL